MRININVKILLVLVSLVWGVVAFAVQSLRGYVLSLIPLAGLGLLLWYGFCLIRWVIRTELENRDSIKMMMNLIGNLGLLFRSMHKKNPGKTQQLIELLILEPEAFKTRAGITTPD